MSFIPYSYQIQILKKKCITQKDEYPCLIHILTVFSSYVRQNDVNHFIIVLIMYSSLSSNT